jgi:hypothetical protein
MLESQLTVTDKLVAEKFYRKAKALSCVKAIQGLGDNL